MVGGVVYGNDFAAAVEGGLVELVAGVVEEGEDGGGAVVGDDAGVVLKGEVEVEAEVAERGAELPDYVSCRGGDAVDG